MKIVAVNGSPTGSKGTTGRTLAALVEGARSEGAEVQIFELGAGTVKPCISCHTCQREGRCVIEDDCPAIHRAMVESDGLVLASPNYIYNVSAQMKAFLDRSFSMFHCQTLNGTYGASVIASGGPGYELIENYLMRTLGGLGCWKVGNIVAAGGALDDPDQAPGILQEARQLGISLAKAIAAKTSFAEQIEERSNTFEIMRWLVESQKDQWPYEYRYWQEHWRDTVIKPE